MHISHGVSFLYEDSLVLCILYELFSVIRTNQWWHSVLEMPFSGKWQTETKPMPMKKQTKNKNKYQTDFYSAEKYQYLTKF